MVAALQSPTLPNMFSHCQKCNAILKVNEEWHSGRCIECQQWADVLRLVDAIIEADNWALALVRDMDAADIDWIDEPVGEAPNGIILRPNRDS